MKFNLITFAGFDLISLKKSIGRFALFFFIGVFSLSLITLSGCSKNKKDNYKGMTAEQIFAQSQKNIKRERWARAVEDLEALEARYPYGEYSDKCQLDLIYAYYKKNEPSMALSTADRFLRLNPRHPKCDYVYSLKGKICYDQNMTFMYKHLPIDRSARDSSNATDAYDNYKALVERYPNSPYAKEAREKMISLRDQLAHHELYVVQYYMKRGAYLSAANRANYVVKNFNDTTAVPDALEMMSASYRKLGMEDLAIKADQTLQQCTVLQK